MRSLPISSRSEGQDAMRKAWLTNGITVGWGIRANRNCVFLNSSKETREQRASAIQRRGPGDGACEKEEVPNVCFKLISFFQRSLLRWLLADTRGKPLRKGGFLLIAEELVQGEISEMVCRSLALMGYA